MKFQVSLFSMGRIAITPPHNTSKKPLQILLLTLTLLTIIPLCLLKYPHSHSLLSSTKLNPNGLESTELEKPCNIFAGNWVPHPKGPYYTNETCPLIIEQHNCMKRGRKDTEFLKWRWKPDECSLPLFNAAKFLELVRGKSMAFVGDSVGSNQMYSLICLLSNVAYPVNVPRKYSPQDYSARWFYTNYKFTLATIWSPFLVKSADADPDGHSYDSLMNLYLDKPDETWASQIEEFDYVIISAGQWFFRPLVYYADEQPVACYKCHRPNITNVTQFYGYQMAFRTAFKTLQRKKRYNGITILRTFSPAHFENGTWNGGGNCARTRPFTRDETKFDGYNLEFYLTQVKELKKAEKEGRQKGLKFLLLDTTEAMLLRPDGHPNYYGFSPRKHEKVADCVHWCLPGPIDTWNEILLYMIERESMGYIETYR